jgi:hypothetical protein
MMQSAREILEAARRAARDLGIIERQEAATPTSAAAERLKEMTLTRMQSRRELDERRVNDAIDLILGCPDLDERESNVLLIRYCNCKEWREVAELMRYSVRPCQKCAASGLAKLESFVASGGWESHN